MEIEHIREGCPEPILNEGRIYLYSMRFCPFAHRVHLALNAKGVIYTPIYLNLAKKPEWYVKKFPAGKVPALLYKNEFLYESLLLTDFLNDEFQHPPLYPKDNVKKLKDKLFIQNFGKVTEIFYKLAFGEYNTANFTSLVSELQNIEAELAERNEKYFGGDKPLMIDYMIWPWFERIDSLPTLYGDVAKLPEADLPKLIQWMSIMKEDRVVQSHYLPPIAHAKHIKLRKINSDEAFDGTF